MNKFIDIDYNSNPNVPKSISRPSLTLTDKQQIASPSFKNYFLTTQDSSAQQNFNMANSNYQQKIRSIDLNSSLPKVQDNSSQKSVWASVSKVARSSLQDSNDYSAATLSSVNQDIFSSQVSKLHANIFDNEQGNSLLGKQSKSNS